MSLLDKVSKPADRAIIATFCGDAGTGKTSTAATFNKPIFIRAEDGMQSIPADVRPDAFPLITKVEELWEQLTTLVTEEHDYKTLVIDSVTALERLFVTTIVENDPKKPRSINQALGGYGAGLSAVAAYHQRVRKACGILNSKKGMNIIFIAHADTETLELPDQDPYTRYNLRLGKKSVAPYVDDSDVVGFLRLVTYTIGDGERKKAVSDGSIEMITYATASNISKNRYGITDPINVEKGVNPLKQYIPSLNTKPTKGAKQ